MFIVAFGVINKQLLSTTQQGYQVDMGTPSPGLASWKASPPPFVFTRTTVFVGTDPSIVDPFGSKFSEGVFLVGIKQVLASLNSKDDDMSVVLYLAVVTQAMVYTSTTTWVDSEYLGTSAPPIT